MAAGSSLVRSLSLSWRWRALNHNGPQRGTRWRRATLARPKDQAFVGPLREPKRGDVFSCIPSLAGNGHWMHCSGFGQTCSSDKPGGIAAVTMVLGVFWVLQVFLGKTTIHDTTTPMALVSLGATQ